MNSYTSTSKKMKSFIFTFFISFILTIIAIDILLEYYASTKTTTKRFITEKQSKIKHCQLNNPINKDAIFVGSSRTFYHISTNEFKKNGMDIYNLGISNNALEDYSSFVKEAIKYNPKAIVISIEVNELFRQLPLSKYPTYDDLSTYIDTMNSEYVIFLSIQWLQNFHSLLRYSESIYIKIESFYKKFNVHLNVNKSVDKNDVINYGDIADCKIFSKKSKSDSFLTAKCENGDGILFGNDNGFKKLEVVKLNGLDCEMIKFMNYLIKEIKEAQIQPIVVLEPVCKYSKKYGYNFDNIEKNLDTTVVDLTELNINKNLWIDPRHFNNEGRLFYSKYLASKLQEIIK